MYSTLLFVYCWIHFLNLLLGIFYIYAHDKGRLWFYCLVVSLLCLVSLMKWIGKCHGFCSLEGWLCGWCYFFLKSLFKIGVFCFLNIWMFSFSTWTIFQCLLAFSIFVEKLTVNVIVTPLRIIICLFPLWLLWIFSLCLWCTAVFTLCLRTLFFLVIVSEFHPFKILDLFLLS